MSKTTHSPTLAELLKMAKNTNGFGKQSFTDPATMAGGGAPPGGDPMAAMGGAPPGGDPMAAMGGGMPPADPAAGAAPPMGGGADPLQAIMDKLNQIGMGGGAGGGEPIKPKIDVNVEIMQMKNLLALICDKLQIPVPATSMVATPEKLTAMAQGQDAASGVAAPMQSAISPIEPMQAAAPGMGMPPAGGGGGEKKSASDDGEAFGPITQVNKSMTELSGKALAVSRLMGGK
jgi:hypothetical protein